MTPIAQLIYSSPLGSCIIKFLCWDKNNFKRRSELDSEASRVNSWKHLCLTHFSQAGSQTAAVYDGGLSDTLSSDVQHRDDIQPGNPGNLMHVSCWIHSAFHPIKTDI